MQVLYSHEDSKIDST